MTNYLNTFYLLGYLYYIQEDENMSVCVALLLGRIV